MASDEAVHLQAEIEFLADSLMRLQREHVQLQDEFAVVLRKVGAARLNQEDRQFPHRAGDIERVEDIDTGAVEFRYRAS